MSLSCELFISLCKCLPVQRDAKHVEEIWRILKISVELYLLLDFPQFHSFILQKRKKMKMQSFSFSIKHFSLD